MLDVRRLLVLREFAAEGTIAKTAERLSYTPSAVSQQLAQLQREAGVQLFRHEGRRLELTDAGRLLLERGSALIGELEALDAELALQEGAVRGSVRIAAFQTAAHSLVLPAIARIAAAYPELDTALVEAEAEAAIPELMRGGLDVVIAEEYPNAPRPRAVGLVRRNILQDEMLLALPQSHAAAKTKTVRLAKLRDARWVTARQGTAYSEMAIGLCRSLGGFEPNVKHRANDLRLMLELVRAEGCVAIIPALGETEAGSDVAVRHVADGRLTRVIFLLSRASDAARPSTTAVVDGLERTAAALSRKRRSRRRGEAAGRSASRTRYSA
jgi:DNA-binding transcriptional LysR family regulator